MQMQGSQDQQQPTSQAPQMVGMQAGRWCQLSNLEAQMCRNSPLRLMEELHTGRIDGGGSLYIG
jgi:hypothetical protein